MVDLTTSIDEKYGEKQSFQLKLRLPDKEEDYKEKILYKHPVHSAGSDQSFAYTLIDDRQGQVELIRQSFTSDGLYGDYD